MPTLSVSSARFLLELVNGLQPHAGAPDFRDAVAAITRAQDELEAIIAEPRGLGAHLLDR